MTLKIKCFFPILLCLLLSCCESPVHRPPDYITMANRLLSKTAKQLKKEKDLIPIGDSGQMMGNIKSMGLECEYFLFSKAQSLRFRS